MIYNCTEMTSQNSCAKNFGGKWHFKYNNHTKLMFMIMIILVIVVTMIGDFQSDS